MWAQRLSAPGHFELVQAPAPSRLENGQVMLRVSAGGICGSDIPKFRGHKGFLAGTGGRAAAERIGYPLHEVAGEVVASRHPDHRPGMQVVGWATRSDALAELVVTSGDQVCEYDPALSLPAAVLVQSVACVLYAVDQLKPADASVAIIGLGPIGLLFAHALKTAGARSVAGIDVVERSAPGRACLMDEVICASSASWSTGLTDGGRPQLIVEAVGHQVSTLQHAIEAVAPGGRILCFGIPDDDVYPINMERMMRKNITLIAGVTRQRRAMLAKASAYVRDHPELTEALVSATYPATAAQQAFELACTTAPDRIKVILTMG